MNDDDKEAYEDDQEEDYDEEWYEEGPISPSWDRVLLNGGGALLVILILLGVYLWFSLTAPLPNDTSYPGRNDVTPTIRDASTP